MMMVGKNTCDVRHILKSNEVKVQANGQKVTSLQAKSTTLALEYFVTLKSNQMLLNALLLLRYWTSLPLSNLGIKATACAFV